VLRTTDISCSSLTSRSRLLIIFCSLVSLSPSAVVFFPYTTLFRSVIGIPYSSAESNSVVQVDAAKEAAESLDEEIEEVAVTNTSDRKSTCLNSSHVSTSYAVFCLNKKKNEEQNSKQTQQRNTERHD